MHSVSALVSLRMTFSLCRKANADKRIMGPPSYFPTQYNFRVVRMNNCPWAATMDARTTSLSRGSSMGITFISLPSAAFTMAASPSRRCTVVSRTANPMCLLHATVLSSGAILSN